MAFDGRLGGLVLLVRRKGVPGFILTALPVWNFFSVATMAPLRWAAFRAADPRTTVSRWAAPAPRVRLPILVTESQSSDIMTLAVFGVVGGGVARALEMMLRRLVWLGLLGVVVCGMGSKMVVVLLRRWRSNYKLTVD